MFSWVDSGLSEKQGLFLILLSFMSPVSLSTGLTQRWHARRICWAELIWKETVISTVRYCRKVQQTRAWNASGAFDPQEVPDDLSKSSCWSLLLVEAIIQAAEALMVGKNWRPFITLSSGDRERNGIKGRVINGIGMWWIMMWEGLWYLAWQKFPSAIAHTWDYFNCFHWGGYSQLSQE